MRVFSISKRKQKLDATNTLQKEKCNVLTLHEKKNVHPQYNCCPFPKKESHFYFLRDVRFLLCWNSRMVVSKFNLDFGQSLLKVFSFPKCSFIPERKGKLQILRVVVYQQNFNHKSIAAYSFTNKKNNLKKFIYK